RAAPTAARVIAITRTTSEGRLGLGRFTRVTQPFGTSGYNGNPSFSSARTAESAEYAEEKRGGLGARPQDADVASSQGGSR
ncbi:MAG: hypothetical protein QOF16_1111, partial [Actinomycetota bacterium]|nr:hypothetical protein [Actinomycetota bacterium]